MFFNKKKVYSAYDIGNGVKNIFINNGIPISSEYSIGLKDAVTINNITKDYSKDSIEKVISGAISILTMNLGFNNAKEVAQFICFLGTQGGEIQVQEKYPNETLDILTEIFGY